MGRRLPWNWSRPRWKALRSPATNLPRKTRLSTPIGRKKERRGERQQWGSDRKGVAGELEQPSMEGAAKSGDELAAEDTAEHPDRQKEGAPGGDPAGVIRRQTTGGQYAVDMGMKLQALVPAVEHAEEAYLGPKMPGIASDLQQGFGAGMKQQVVNQPLVLQCEWG